jgi:hypothetical protein
MSAPQAAPPQSPYTQIFPTAAAMLWSDRLLILMLYPLLIITGLLGVDILSPSSANFEIIMICDRVLQLLFGCLVTARWIRRLSQTPRKISGASIARFYLFGLTVWALFTLPLAVVFTGELPALTFASSALVSFGLWLGLVFFFYPVPILLGRAPLSEALNIARQINVGERLLPIKLMIAPAGFLSLALALVMSISPDGRYATVLYLSQAVTGIFWVLLTYLSLAAAILRLDEKVWREEQLDPYRAARLSTLEFQGSTWLGSQLRPGRGMAWLAISVLVWVGNLVRLFSTPPAATINVERIAIQGSEVRITLQLKDEQYGFRGMQPLYFALAGEQRAVIAPNPQRGSIAGTEGNFLFILPSDRKEVEMELTFAANRVGDELRALQDLHLWYRSVKLMRLDMQNAELLPDSVAPAGGADQSAAVPKQVGD